MIPAIAVKDGVTKEITCKVDTNKPSEITWYKLTQSSSGVSKKTKLSTAATVNHLPIEILEEGTYICEATNKYGSSQSIMKLDCKNCYTVLVKGDAFTLLYVVYYSTYTFFFYKKVVYKKVGLQRPKK